ncbi:MAG: hypothetical protein ABR905_13680 [Terracidiphilus sp.]
MRFRFPLVTVDERRAGPPNRWVTGLMRAVFGLALLLALPGGAQYSATQADAPQAGRQRGGLFGGMDDTDPVAQEKRLRTLNAERQKSLVSDTNKLLKLARELDEEIKRTNPSSLDQIQMTKVAEIEKLAHQVKEKMSTPVQGTTDSQSFPFSPAR